MTGPRHDFPNFPVWDNLTVLVQVPTGHRLQDKTENPAAFVFPKEKICANLYECAWNTTISLQDRQSWKNSMECQGWEFTN
jgi:hypothetical protein